jgi:CubicO group peptidase (beta-lactamase class C family)
MKSKQLLLVSALLTTLFYKAQVPANINQSLQNILEASLPTTYNGSGVILRVTVPGQWSWSGAVGKAISGNTSGQPATTAQATDKFRAGSITKMMVATCILKLQQDGLLSIEHPISDYLRSTLLNDTIQSSGTITIRQLLNHTSGIANSADNSACQQGVLLNPTGAHTLEEAVYCGASQGEIFPPGFAWAYSNTNYTLLAMIIEEVTGLSYKTYLTNTIITPVGLTHTEIPDADQISGSHLGCYWNIGSWIDLTIVDPTTYTGWADVVSTTEDLITYYQALQNGQLINTAQLSIMKTIDEASYDYGMGLDFYSFFETNYVGHYGEVANTSGLFFGQTASSVAPSGYYISYNFNVQGADMINKIDKPIMQLMMGNTAQVVEIEQNDVEIRPNPADDHFTIEYHATELQGIRICEASGKVVYDVKIKGDTGTQTIDCSAFKSGFYLVNIETLKGSKTQRLMIK